MYAYKYYNVWATLFSNQFWYISAGFSHRNQPTSIDLNSVRLCFQVFLEGDKKGKFTVPLQAVVSEPVFDKKTASDLVIVKLSHCVCPADGNRDEIILLCEKVKVFKTYSLLSH